jgi:hypothetical protein
MTSSTSSDDDKVVAFPASEVSPEDSAARRLKPEVEQITPEERARRIQVEVNRLANLSPGEWMFWLDSVAEERGIDKAKLKEMIEATVRANEKKAREAKAEDRQREQRADRERTAARREQEREQERERKEQERERREQERKDRERAKEFEKIIALPRAERDKGLADAAKRLGEDVEELRTEFTELTASGESIKGRVTWVIEPWSEPVETAALLTGIYNKIRKHVAIRRPEQLAAITLWVPYDWIHHHPANPKSMFLIPLSQDPDSGKTTLVKMLRYLVARPFTTAEPTGPNIYRTVDAEQPTFMIDEADNLFARKSDVRAIINASWTRGFYIRRGGHDFDPFCPKIISALGRDTTRLPEATLSRSMVIEMFPAKPGEIDDDNPWNELDDDEFADLRRKLARWSIDNIEAIVNAAPIFPPSVINRDRANWKLLLAIAEHAGKEWAGQARNAASYLLRGTYEPSWGVRLMAELDEMFQKRLKITTAEDKIIITSEEFHEKLLADPLSPWHEYTTAHKRAGKISENQIAALFKKYRIYPTTIHPTGRSNKTKRGYRWVECRDMLARFRNRFALARDNRDEKPTEKPATPKRKRIRSKSKGREGRECADVWK